MGDVNDGVWFGFVITDSIEFVVVRDDCSYDVSFEFMGRRIA